ncbi:MAG TPA: TlyA family RNA methyltransferase [Thermoanaerobaculia bacterium]|nr:TlyA family RNA methyltransferase [Thermoanaerobaculia bacterium]
MTASPGAKKVRLDLLLVERGLFETREQAQRALMAGAVAVNGRRVDKAGTAVAVDSLLEVAGPREPFVSRAGRKLAAALDHFAIDPRGRVCLDVGAGTGGFTDCLLQRGAVRVYALDVGRGQLHASLRADPRVVVLEGRNARHLDANEVPEPIDLMTIDVSFISLRLVAPAVIGCLAAGGDLVALIKPQFEAPRGSVGKGGILRDEELRRSVIAERARDLEVLGLDLLGVIDSPVTGAGGNREPLAHLRRPTPS